MKYRRKYQVLIRHRFGYYSIEVMARNMDVARMFAEKRIAPNDRVHSIRDATDDPVESAAYE